MALVYCLVLVSYQLLNTIQNFIRDIINKKAEHLYEIRMAQKLSKLPLSFLDSATGKDIVQDVRYTESTAIYIIFNVVEIVAHIYSLLVSFYTLVNFSLIFSILFLFVTIPSVICNEYISKKTEELRTKRAPDERRFSYYRWMLTSSTTAKDIRMYDLTNPIKGRYLEEKQKYVDENKKLDKNKLLLTIMSELLRRCGEILFIIYVVISAVNNTIAIGDISLFIGLAIGVSVSFENVMWSFVDAYYRITTRMQQMFEFFDIRTEETEKEYRELNCFESIKFDNVYFKYPYTDKYVLSGISFEINKGDKVSIVGINGSGKSTIVKLMLGLYTIESGEIKINNYPIADYRIEDVRKLFSVVFQNYVHYPLTLGENIAMSNIEEKSDISRINNAIACAGFYDEIKNKMNVSIDTYMTRQFSDDGIELSKGQWQKIALARAYFKGSDVYIFDEPSSALDAEAEDLVFKNYHALSLEKTSIMISHRISASRFSNKIIVISEGKMIECGTHEYLVSIGGLYSHLYSLQMKKYCEGSAK